MDVLKLNNLEVRCIIGDLPEERVREQTLSVNVELYIDMGPCIESDSLSDTVDYAALGDEIRETLRRAKCRMIEKAAGIVCDVCLASPSVQKVAVRVVKRGAVPGLESAEVCLERENGKN